MPGSCVLALARGQRRGEVGFGQFLRNPSVTVAELCSGAAHRTSEDVAGHDVLAIQDTSDIVLGAKKVRALDYGPAGKGGGLGEVLVHLIMAVDVTSGEVPVMQYRCLRISRCGTERVAKFPLACSIAWKTKSNGVGLLASRILRRS